MKLTCDREKLLQAFQTVGAVAPTRSPKPILQNVKLEVTPEVATLIATDLEVGIRMDVPGFKVDVPGSVILPKDRFGAILHESSDASLMLESDGRQTQIIGQQSKFHLPAENPDEFPIVSVFAEEQYHLLPARLLREVIHRTVFAADNESSRYALGGVLFELADDRLTAVATDGRRLARQNGPAEAVAGHSTSESKTIIPTRAVQLIERALANHEGNVQLAVRENDVLVKSERATIYARLVEGRYPKWQDVFPSSEGTTEIELPVAAFHAAVRQAAIVTSEDRRGVDFTFGDGRVVLSGHGAELGESHVEMPIAYEGATINITLDPRYLSDFLKVLDSESTVSMRLKDAGSAAVCTTDDDYAYVIMPLARDDPAGTS